MPVQYRGWTLFQVDRHVKRFAREQVHADVHALVPTEVSANVDREGVDKVVHDATKVNQIAQEKGERLDAFFLTKGRQSQPVRIHI